MNKKLALKVLFNNPIEVIKEGIRVREQAYFKKKLISEHNTEQLPTIDILDLFPDLQIKIIGLLSSISKRNFSYHW